MSFTKEQESVWHERAWNLENGGNAFKHYNRQTPTQGESKTKQRKNSDMQRIR